VGLEGALRIGLGVTGGAISRVGVSSTRPDVARALLQGRSRAEALAALPLVFSICARSQAAAGTLACAAAAGEPIPAETLARHAAIVGDEILREGAWRTLLDWPAWMDEPPSTEAVQAARGSLGLANAETAAACRDAIALAAFGCPAEDWLVLDTLPEFDRWLAAGATATARFIRRVCDQDSADGAPGRLVDDPPLFAAGPDAELNAATMRTLSEACDSDPGFARHPTWQGMPAETGALARRQADPLLIALRQRSASRLPARFVARLRELALQLAGRTQPALGALALGAGRGIAWVENARGLLVHQVHQVHLDAGRIGQYRIVAPTEWNFHPGGALQSALIGAPASDLTSIKRQAAQVVHSLDPCVACCVEFDDA
jgi:hypothetical protein